MNDYPWIYDVGVETMRIIDANTPREEKEQALFEFQDIVKMSTRLPIMEEFMDSKSDFILYEEMPRMLIREMERYMDRKSNKNITKP